MEGGRGPQGQSIDTNCTVVIHETLQAVHNLLLTVINKNYNREKIPTPMPGHLYNVKNNMMREKESELEFLENEITLTSTIKNSRVV